MKDIDLFILHSQCNADDLTTRGYRISAGMVLTKFTQNCPVSAPEGF